MFFYRKNDDDWKKIKAKYKTVCVEMESFALFANALALKKNAATLLTISDSFITGAMTQQQLSGKIISLILSKTLDEVKNPYKI